MLIEFFSPEDLSHIAAILAERREVEASMSPEAHASVAETIGAEPSAAATPDVPVHPNTSLIEAVPPPLPVVEPDEDLYSVHNFTV